MSDFLLFVLAILLLWIGLQIIALRDELLQIINDLATMLGEQLEQK